MNKGIYSTTLKIDKILTKYSRNGVKINVQQNEGTRYGAFLQQSSNGLAIIEMCKINSYQHESMSKHTIEPQTVRSRII